MAVQHPTLDPLIGVWHSRGQVLDEDGATVVATIEGTDIYEWLGPTVVHRADVMMGDRHTRSLEVIEPYDADLGAFPTRAYDDEGGVDDSTATVDDEGVWTFRGRRRSLHANDGDRVMLVVDAADHAVGAASGDVTVLQRRVEALSDPVRVVEQGADDELMGGEGDGLWQVLRELAPGRRGDQEGVALLVGHAPSLFRRAMAAARSDSDSWCPAASSASEALSRSMASGSDSTAIVSSREARSSGASRIAEGLPCTVIVTRSC